jgi:hypothetical protein
MNPVEQIVSAIAPSDNSLFGALAARVSIVKKRCESGQIGRAMANHSSFTDRSKVYTKAFPTSEASAQPSHVALQLHPTY